MCGLDRAELLRLAEDRRKTAELEESVAAVSLFEPRAGEFRPGGAFPVARDCGGSAVFCSLRSARGGVSFGRGDSRGFR